MEAATVGVVSVNYATVSVCVCVCVHTMVAHIYSFRHLKIDKIS